MASRLDFTRFQAETVSDVSDRETVRTAPEELNVPKPTQRPRVTAAMVDEAVERVLERVDYPETTKNTMRSLLATDPNSGFANSFYLDRAEVQSYNAHPALSRRTVNITLVHTPSESAELAAYAPEFDLRFSEEDTQDHAVGASMRKLDHQILLAKVPRGIALKDVGGNPVYHVRAGTPNVHVCSPDADKKDGSRFTMRRMHVAKVARSSGYSEQSYDLANAYLRKDQNFVCSQRAQECRKQARVTMSCHVYDVPMQDWPRIMRASGASMHVGCLLFPTEAFSRTSGTLQSSQARYEIDVESNTINMGFEGAASWWYSHNWLDFMRYGADQLIDYEGERYSYKIVEKRGDTVFFQILRVSGGVSLGKQWYRLPGVRMVRVQGFDLLSGKLENSVAGRSPLKPCLHWFPAALWEDMLRHAEMEFERGQLSFDKLYNYYRTVSPRNTINGVLISGGQRVAHDEMVALVVHVGMAAATTVMLGQRTSRELTAEEMRQRIVEASSRFRRFTHSLLRTVRTIADLAVYYPLGWMVNMLLEASAGALADTLVSWAYEPDVVEVPFSDVVGHGYMRSYADWTYYDQSAEEDSTRHYVRNVLADHLRALERAPACAALVNELCADGLTAEELDTVRRAATTIGSSTAVDVEENGPVTAGDVKRISAHVPGSEQVSRRNAILECIEESQLEEKSIEHECGAVYRRCMGASGEPIEATVRKRAEEFRQPDFWPVRGGILGKSLLGVNPADCRYSAGYSPHLSQDGSHFHTLLDESYDPGSKGVGEPRDYKVVADRNLHGWLMTMDRLVVYNGPEVRETLRRAVDMDHNYTVILEQGPPGCGKTYALIQSMKDEDAAMCPVRESAIDTRAQLVASRPGFQDAKLRVRTVDSYLVNYSVEATQELRANVLRADEAFMTHSGKWYAAAALLGVREVYAYGDKQQIPHIPRVQAPKHYVRLKADVETEKFITRRCPADAVAAWGEVYDWRVRTVSPVVRSMTTHKSAAGLVPPVGCVLMCMYQADSKELRKMFSSQLKSLRLRVMTSHESEGKTFDHVWLFRFDSRKRDDKKSLFDQRAHCLVAMSRHRKTFRYIRPVCLGDQVDQWIEKAQDVRRVAAAAQAESQGQSVEFV